MSVKLGVAENYVNVLRARSARDVADQLVMNLAAHLEDAENLFDQGLAPLNDVLAVRTALANGRENAVRAANAVDLAEAAYNRALGRPLELEVRLDDVSAGSNELTLDMLLDLARTNRSELRAHKAREQALRHKSNAERADMAPRVGISGGYTYLENTHLRMRECGRRLLELSGDSLMAAHRGGVVTRLVGRPMRFVFRPKNWQA